jgi:lipid II isoglutaminyl synthase (glutamine-hydrolysing)
LRLVWLYPELMNTYGDRGNVLILADLARRNQVPLEVVHFNQGDSSEILCNTDIFLMGGAQDRQQAVVMQDFTPDKQLIVTEQLQSGTPALLVCGAYQLFGRQYIAADGSSVPGVGLLPITTVSAPTIKQRLVGNCIVETALWGTVIGFENHGGRTVLDSDATPLGRVIHGFGNTDTDGHEGILWQSVIGTYLHGCVLAKNPRMSEWLLQKALEKSSDSHKKISVTNNEVIEAARQEILRRWGK